MFANTYLRRTTRLISIISTGLILTGCGESAEEILTDFVSVPPTESSDLSDIDVPVGPAFIDAEPPVIDESDNEIIVFNPPLEEPEPPVFEQPVSEPPAFEPPLVQPPIAEQDPEILDEPPEVTLGQPSDSAIALQRLQPFTRYDYTNFSDGATFFAAFQFSDAELVDDGEDSTLTLELDASLLSCSFLSDVETYVCFDVFFDSGNGFLDLFTLGANNTGEGIFIICDNFVANIEDCVTELITTPQGTSVVTAGIQTAFADSGTRSGNEYLDYLVQSEPAGATGSADNVSEIVERVQRLVNQTINQ